MKKIRENIRLSEEEKKQMMSNLSQRISEYEKKSEKNVIIGNDNRLGIGGDKKSFNIFFKKKTMFTSIATFLTIALSLGTSAAANISLPGDFLYPVKVHVNENIKSAFAVSAENEARLQLELIEERLEEKRELMSKGKLSASLKAKIDTSISKHKARFESEYSKIEDEKSSENNTEASSYTDTGLKIQLKSLLDLNSSLESNAEVEVKSETNTTSTGSEVESESKTEVITDINIDLTGDSGTIFLTGSSDSETDGESSVSVSGTINIDEYEDMIDEVIDSINIKSNTNIESDNKANSSSGNSSIESRLDVINKSSIDL